MPTAAQEEHYRQQQQRRRQRERFARARRAETWYGIQLRKIAQQIGALTGIYNPADPDSASILEQALRSYAQVIAPWARNTATRMLADVARRDADAWKAHSRELGIALREEIAEAPTGQLLKALLAEQVTLITSLPIEAAKRVHELALRGITEGDRGGTIFKMIMASGEVTKARATLIARTETARTASSLTQARAEWVGSEGYIWRTAKDEDVRPALSLPPKERARFIGSHRALEGKFIRWDDPPVSGQSGERAHAGCIYNCRCYAEVVLPERKAA